MSETFRCTWPMSTRGSMLTTRRYPPARALTLSSTPFKMVAVLSAAVRPRGPFSLRLSGRLSGDATRTLSGGPLVAALAAGGAGRAWQEPDGVVQLRAPDEAGPEG